MAKVIRNLKSDQQEFVKTIEKLSNRFQMWEVWSDFIVMYATAISNSVDMAHREKREETYMRTVKKYSKEELELFPKLCAITIEALERDRDQDFLGEMYMALNLGNHWTGQFFTPYNVCRMMAEMNCGNTVEEVKNKGYMSVCDPCCGAGALLIAFANTACRELSKKEMNFQNHILFVAQDVDMITGLMCYIQLSLLGCAGYVKIGDSLSNPMTEGEAIRELSQPDSNYWYMPMFFSDVWQYRWLFHSLDKITTLELKQEKTVSGDNLSPDETPKPQTIELKTEGNGQLSLF